MEILGNVVVLLVLVVAVAAMSIVIIPQQKMGLIERLGKFNRVLGPGLNL
jgi:regulator of protease activity HflC (stomatin/prohibitin superfamily)